MHSVLNVFSLFNRLTSTPLSEKANALMKKGAYKDLVSISVDPLSYDDYAAYRRDAQVVSLTRKLAGLPTGVDLKKEALTAAAEAEQLCVTTNRRLSYWVNSRERGYVSESSSDDKIWDIISQIRRRVSEVLGPLPVDLCLRFGNGATYGDRGKKITICHKMASRPTITPRALPYLDLVRQTLWWTANSLSPLVVRGNRFTTVPKDSKKDRGIAVEPSVNVALQLAVGSIIRERLKRVEIHIDGKDELNAQTVHRDLARQGSLNGSLATIDLSSASDTISYNLVKLLLPTKWFELLDDLRSHETEIEGKWIKNHKFSSMGNGFTFELETLIFWAITSVIAGSSKVYGDDIIIRNDSFRDVAATLRYFGFVLNANKSFSDGPFRESCGGDYFGGFDVRPVFFKTVPSNPLEWITFHNLMWRASRHLPDWNRRRLSNVIVQNIPSYLRLYGPEFLGDSVLHSDDRSRWNIRQLDGITSVRSIISKSQKIQLNQFTGPVQLASALLGAPSQGVPIRNSVSGWKKGWLSVS